MAIRHKLQKVFIDEEEEQNCGQSASATNYNNYPYATPSRLPPPYPFKNEVNYAAPLPLQGATIATSTSLGDLQPNVQYMNNQSGQQLQSYSANNNYCYNNTADNHATYTYQSETGEPQTYTYLP